MCLPFPEVCPPTSSHLLPWDPDVGEGSAASSCAGLGSQVLGCFVPLFFFEMGRRLSTFPNLSCGVRSRDRTRVRARERACMCTLPVELCAVPPRTEAILGLALSPTDYSFVLQSFSDFSSLLNYRGRPASGAEVPSDRAHAWRPGHCQPEAAGAVRVRPALPCPLGLWSQPPTPSHPPARASSLLPGPSFCALQASLAYLHPLHNSWHHALSAF